MDYHQGQGFPQALVAPSGYRPALAFHPEQDECLRHQASDCYHRGCPVACLAVLPRLQEPVGPWESPCHHSASKDAPRCQTKVGFVASGPEDECCHPMGDSSEVRGEPCRPPWGPLLLRLRDPSKVLLRHRRHLVAPDPAPAGRRESPPKGPAPGPCYSRQILTIS